MTSDLHGIIDLLWAIFFILLLESLRNWCDWRNRHPHLTRPVPKIAIHKRFGRPVGGGIGTCPPNPTPKRPYSQ